MKSERRHELAENDLADSVEHLAERFRPYVATILTAAIGGLVAVIVGLFVSSRWEASRAESWDACLAALTTGNEDAFREVLIRYPGTPAAQWAELVLADRAVSEATSLLFQKLDPANDIARQRLEQAVSAYQSLLAEQADGMIAVRATFGLAKARECLGELDEARRGYEAVAGEYADSPLADLAAAHADDLARADTRAFYDWFFRQREESAPDESATGPAGGEEAAADGKPADTGPDADAAEGTPAAEPAAAPPGKPADGLSEKTPAAAAAESAPAAPGAGPATAASAAASPAEPPAAETDSEKPAAAPKE